MTSKSRVKNVPLSRPPLERMLRIHQELQAGKYPNAVKLARDLEVSSKSIHRDLEFMRDRFLLPLEFDRARNGFYYTEQVNAFPTMQITEGELFALLVAEKALQQYRGTTFEKPLLSAIKKLETSLPNTISLSMNEFDQTISFRTSAEQILNFEVFDALSKAAAQRQQLKIVYRKPGKRETETRIVDPYHLSNINGEWFLFAFDHARKDIRRFVPARIQSVTPTAKKFVRPQKFSIEKFLRHSFGVHSAEGEYDVVLQFSESAADYIREKKWHASQELRELENGGVELRLKLSSLAEIQRWILGWAGNVKVIQPPELISAVEKTAREILRNHSANESCQAAPVG